MQPGLLFLAGASLILFCNCLERAPPDTTADSETTTQCDDFSLLQVKSDLQLIQATTKENDTQLNGTVDLQPADPAEDAFSKSTFRKHAQSTSASVSSAGLQRQVVERIRKSTNGTQVTSLQAEGFQAIMGSSAARARAQQASSVQFSSAPHTDDTRSHWWIGGLTYMSTVVTMALVSWSMRRNPTRVLQFIVLCSKTLSMAGAAAIIPDSYGLVRQLDHGAIVSGIMSGFLIGCLYLPASATSIHMTSIFSTIHSESVRSIWLASYIATPALLLACTVIVNQEMVGIGGGILCLLACRCGVGFVDGYLGVCQSLTLWKVTPKADMVTWETLCNCALAFGIGFGPLLNSGCSWVSGSRSYEEEIAWSSCCVALLWMPIVFHAWLWIPMELEDMLECKSKADQQHESALEIPSGEISNVAQDEVEGLPVLAREQIWRSAAFFGIERAFAVSSIEAATALILESEFYWDTRSIGLGIGFAFVCGVPAAFALVRVIKHASLVSNSHAMMGTATTAMLAATLFIPAVSNLIAAGLADSSKEWILILVADGIMFPSFYIANGYMDGLAIRCCDPATPYTMENYKLISKIGQDTVGRTLGPPIARAVISMYGRGAYAILQLCLSASGCFACGRVMLRLSKDYWNCVGKDGEGIEQPPSRQQDDVSKRQKAGAA